MALCEAAAYYKKQGKTLWDQMLAIYDKYGYYKDSVKSVTMKGIEGLAKIAQTMETTCKCTREYRTVQGTAGKRLQVRYLQKHGDRRGNTNWTAAVKCTVL